MNRKDAPIYLDYQATTPTDPRVLDRMLPWFTERFGNPHSAEHRHGWEAAEAIDAARREIAALIGASAKEITLTSGATEANNLAVIGAARAQAARDGRRRVITVASEHACVLESARSLRREGFDVVELPVDEGGLLDPETLRAALDDRTALVSVMAVNNEIGVIQPLAEIGRLCREAGALFHTDAAQAVGKIPIDVREIGAALLSISGHKIYGPKGVGALFVRRRPRVPLEPLFHGGGQERGLRSGTLAPPLCVGLGAACAIAAREMEAEAARLAGFRDTMLARLREGVPAIQVNGSLDRRIPGNLNVTFPGIEASELMAALDGVAVSSGSACSSGVGKPSHVLQAIGLDPARVQASIRIGVGRFTTQEEVDVASRHIVETARRLTKRFRAAS